MRPRSQTSLQPLMVFWTRWVGSESRIRQNRKCSQLLTLPHMDSESHPTIPRFLPLSFCGNYELRMQDQLWITLFLKQCQDYSLYPKKHGHILLKYLHAQGPAWLFFFFVRAFSAKMPMDFSRKDSEGLQAIPDDTILPQAIKIGEGVEFGLPHPKIDVYPAHYYQVATPQEKKTLFGLRKTTFLLSLFNLLMMVALVVLGTFFGLRKPLYVVSIIFLFIPDTIVGHRYRLNLCHVLTSTILSHRQCI